MPLILSGVVGSASDFKLCRLCPQVPGSRDAGATCGSNNMVVDRIVLRPRERQSPPASAKPPKSNFLSHWLGARVRMYEIPMSGGSATLDLPLPTFEEDGRKWELLVAEVHDDGKTLHGGKKQARRFHWRPSGGPPSAWCHAVGLAAHEAPTACAGLPHVLRGGIRWGPS